MGIKKQSDLENVPGTVGDIIRAIEKKITDSGCLFRGESQCYEKVSSNLYRELQAVKVKYSDINDVQTEIVDAAKEYIDEKDEFEILTALQHYGGKTNLIDFTTDYNVALFFACYGHSDGHGRVIILEKNEVVKDMLRFPRDQEHRVRDQKSVFIQPPKGYIVEQQYEEICVPKDLKLFVLEHLREVQDIYPETIYNDLHGFISSQNNLWMAYREFYSGITWRNKGNEANSREEKQKAYKRAVRHYSSALDQNLQLVAVYNNRGDAYRILGKIGEAIADFTTAIELKPDYAKPYVNRGLAHISKGDFDKSIADLNTAVKLKPELAEAYNNRGIVYAKKRDVNKAITDFTKAIELKSDYAEAYNNRGNAYEDKRGFDEAIADFTKAIELKPDYAEAYNNRGVAYGIKDQVDKAIADFTTAINLDPYHAGAYFNRGNAYLLIGDFETAIENYDTSIKLSPDDAQSYCHRGLSQLHLKEWDKAKADLTIAKDKDVDIVAAFHNLYRDVATFERRNSVRLPQDIVAMLRQYPVNSFTTTQRLPTSESYTTMQTDDDKSTARQIILPAEVKSRESVAVLELLEKFRNAGKSLNEYLHGQSSRGITTGCNEAFIIERSTRDALIREHPSSDDILKPFLMARDIQRWRVKPIEEPRRNAQDKWVIFAHRRIDIDTYPAIKKHLGKYRDALEKRSGKQKWYELQTAPTDTTRFTQPKCIYANMASETAFAFDDEGYYVGSPASLLPTSELWLLGVLNTKAVSWFYARTAPQVRGPFLKFVPRYVAQIPIPDMEPEQRTLIRKIVEYILYLKKQPSTDGSDLANSSDYVMVGYFGQILDALVYELYLPDDLHQDDKYFFQPLLDENLPPLEDIHTDKIVFLRELFESLFDRNHPIRRNHFFLDSVKSIRIIESKV